MEGLTLVACPFCKEEIKPESLKCKHCGSGLAAAARADQPATTTGQGFSKANWGLLLLLTLVTFGLYMPFWVNRRFNELNALPVSTKISGGLTTVYTVLYCLGVMMIFVQPVLSNLIIFASNVCALVIAFNMRTILLEYDRLFRQGSERMSGLATFLFNFLYVEERIGRMFGV